MALYSQTNVGASSGTKYDRFVTNAKIGLGQLKDGFVKNVVHSPEGIAIGNAVGDFVDQWLKPASQSAVDVAKDFAQSSVVQNVLPQTILENVGGKIGDIFSGVADNIAPGASSSRGSSYSAARPVMNSGSTLDYKYADLAAHYGMDAKAAYSEALQNTAYERAVADLKRAGLNPVLAAGNVSPAGSFAAGNTLAYGSGSGSSGGYRSSGSAEHVFSPELYNIAGAIATIGGAIAGAKLTPRMPVLGASTGAMITKQATQSVMQFVDSAVRSSRK